MYIFRRVKRFALRVLSRVLKLRGTPEAIALGFSLGMVVAFTPTVGMQLLIAPAVATLFKASRPASLLPIWITNPATIPAVYTFTYKIGAFFWRGPVVARVHDKLGGIARRIAETKWTQFSEHVDSFLVFGADTYVSLWIGGLLVGGGAGAVLYPLVRFTVQKIQLRRVTRKSRKHHWMRNVKARKDPG